MSRVHCAVLNARTSSWFTGSQSYGGHGERETPGLIPNPEAKPLSADGTALETGWESRTPPDTDLIMKGHPPRRVAPHASCRHDATDAIDEEPGHVRRAQRRSARPRQAERWA